jgi:hypothetical protein
MRRSIALLVFSAMPPIAYASDPTGLVYAMTLQAAMFAWPLVLPLFYLGARHNKLRSYFLFLVVALGMLGIVGLPHLLFTIVAAWFSAEEAAFRFVVPLNVGKHLIAFALCIWYLPRFRKLVDRQPVSAT